MDSSVGVSTLAKQSIPEVSILVKVILEHSATLAACQIVGLLSFLGKNTTFVMQGSVFWKGHGYKDKVEEIVKELEPKDKANFVEIPDADINLLFPDVSIEIHLGGELA